MTASGKVRCCAASCDLSLASETRASQQESCLEYCVRGLKRQTRSCMPPALKLSETRTARVAIACIKLHVLTALGKGRVLGVHQDGEYRLAGTGHSDYLTTYGSSVCGFVVLTCDLPQDSGALRFRLIQ